MTTNEMLLRGCMLKNSNYVLGLVVYTGKESRIQMNAAKTPNKVGELSTLACAALQSWHPGADSAVYLRKLQPAVPSAPCSIPTAGKGRGSGGRVGDDALLLALHWQTRLSFQMSCCHTLDRLLCVHRQLIH